MPSRKVFSILIVCSALVVAIILVTGEKSSVSGVAGTLSAGPKVELINNLPADTSWQDTLGALPKSKVFSYTTTSTTSDTSNLTDTVSRSLMANYLALKQGGTLNTDSATQLVNKTIEYIGTTPTKTYTTADIPTIPSNSTSTIRKYGNDLGVVSRYNRPPTSGNPLITMIEISQGRQVEKTSIITDWAKFYHNTATMLSRVVVPSSMITEHLALLNSMSNLSTSLSDMALVNDDPLKAMRGLGMYQSGATSLPIALKALQEKIRTSGISYEQAENGYYLYNDL